MKIFALDESHCGLANNPLQTQRAKGNEIVTFVSVARNLALTERVGAAGSKWRSIFRPYRVADVAHRLNKRWIANLLSQTSYKHLYQLCVVLVRVFPNAFTQLRPRKYASWLTHQDFKQHELARRQFNLA